MLTAPPHLYRSHNHLAKNMCFKMEHPLINLAYCGGTHYMESSFNCKTCQLERGGGGLKRSSVDLPIRAKLVHCVQCRHNQTTLHLCRRHKGLHILGDWWPWPSTICCCVSVLEDGGSLLGT